MDNVTFIKIAGINGEEVEHAIIDRGNGEYTSMPKSVYDEQLEKAKPAKWFKKSYQKQSVMSDTKKV